MSEIHFEYSPVQTAIDDMLQETQAIETILTELESQLNPLRETWEGEDRTAYEQAQKMWDAQVANMRVMLKYNAQVLDSSNEAYRTTELNQSQSWSEL